MQTLVIVDDSPDILLLMRLQFEASPDFQVLEEGSTGQSAVELCGRLQPDVLLLDLSLPDMDGLDALPLIRAAAPDTRVVLHSGFASHQFADRAYELGAVACLEKSLGQGPLPVRLAAALDVTSAV